MTAWLALSLTGDRKKASQFGLFQERVQEYSADEVGR